jgi:polar amino acid transport system permease protein
MSRSFTVSSEMGYNWDFSIVWRYRVELLAGMLSTAWLTIAAVVLGTLSALMLLLARKSPVRILNILSAAFTEVFRNLPVLVVMFWLFFCLPQLLGGPYFLVPFWVAVISLALNFSALLAEILRAGYDSIPPGQIDAARWLGLSRSQILKSIILPQAFWRSLPPALGQSVNTLKLSALASFISVPELFYRTSNIIQSTFRPLELYTALAILYFLLIYPLSLSVSRLERTLSGRFRHG